MRRCSELQALAHQCKVMRYSGLMSTTKTARADAVIRRDFIFRIIIGINHQLPGAVEEFMTIAGEVAQANVFARLRIFIR